MSAEADRSGQTNGTAVLDRVREARAEDIRSGRNPRGRDALVKDLDISPWQAQQALQKLKKQPTGTPPGPHTEPHTADSDERPQVRESAEADGLDDRAEEPISPAPSAGHQSTLSPPPRPWPLLLIGIAAAVAVWSGWVGLGEKCGFGIIQPLPGIVEGFTLNTAITLPISVEAYAAYALRVWLSTSHHSARTLTFAKRSTIISLVIGAAAQAGYHLLEAFGYDRAPWPVVLLVSWVPVVMVGVASGLAKLVKDDRQAGGGR
jgi:hypothetical protein